MVRASSCPDASEWRQFLAGQAPPGRAADLEAHLSACHACRQEVRVVLADDPTPGPGSDAARRALSRPDAPTQATPMSADGPGLGSASTPAARRPDEDDTELGDAPGGPDTRYAFLSPAAGPNELGRLGEYRVLRVLGQGGMGVVFLAEDGSLKRAVALKVMRPAAADAPTARERFLREARTAARVRHDHVVTTYQVGEANGVPFIAMELLAGLPLDRWLKSNPRPAVPQILRIGREAAEGLAAAHEQGLVHRDIKPANLWLEAPRGRVKVLDFGLARQEEDDTHLTGTGMTIGTPAYMAPEQARGEAIDGRADLFSLGCVLYRLCTGRTPFRGTTAIAVLMSLAVDHPAPPREVNPDVPPALDALIQRLLAKDPTQRPASARVVAEELAAIQRDPSAPADLPTAGAGLAAGPWSDIDLTGMLPAGPPSARVPRPAARRARWPVWVALAGLAAVLAVAVLLLRPARSGAVEVASDDPSVRVVLEADGREYPVDGAEARLPAGTYRVRVPAGLTADPNPVSVPAGGRVKLAVRRVPSSVPHPDPKKEPPAGPEPDEALARRVGALPPSDQGRAVIDELRKRNPGLAAEPSATAGKDGGVVLSVVSDKVTDLRPVRALPGLRKLTCGAPKAPGGGLYDLSPLRGTAVTSLTVTQSPGLTDLSPLRGLPLEELTLLGTGVTDLSPLRGLPLRRLRVQGLPVRDLAPLAGMPLESLSLEGDAAPAGTAFTDLAPLREAPLKQLTVTNAPVRDLAPLRGRPLTTLTLTSIKAADLYPLAGLPLATLSADVRADRDAETLKTLKALKTVNGKPVADFWAEADARRAAHDAWAKTADAWVAETGRRAPAEQIKAVADRLRELNPNFLPTHLSGTAVEGGQVVRATLNVSAVTEPGPIRALAGLRALTLTGAGNFSDLSPLRGLPLVFLDCTNSRVGDLSPLRGMRLGELRCGNTLVADLTPLTGMPLEHLQCGLTNVRDLAPLTGAPLKLLDCSNTPVTDLGPLARAPLATLDCSGTRVRDLAPLRGMKLTSLKVSRTPVGDLGPVRDMPLAALWCDRTAVADLGPLRGAGQLKELRCGSTGVSDLSPLAGVPLEDLSCPDTAVADLGPLRGMPLRQLDVRNAAVADLSPLRGAPLAALDVGGNPVRDLSPLRGMATLETLSCRETFVTALGPIRGLRLRALACDFDPVRDAGLPAAVPTILKMNGRQASDVWNAMAAWPWPADPFHVRLAGLSPDDQVKAVADELRRRNPGFDGAVTHRVENGVVSGLTVESAAVADLSPVRHLRGLRSLSCGGPAAADPAPLADLSPLRGLPLRDLSVRYAAVTDLSPLRGLPLRRLTLTGTQPADLAALGDSPVRELVGGFDPTRDGPALRSLPALEVVNGRPAAEFAPAPK